MPHNGRNHQRRPRGNKDDDRSAYSREDDNSYYSRSRQSDHKYRENASGSGRHSYDAGSKEVSSSRVVDSSWQHTEYSGNFQDRYQNKGRRDDYDAVAVLDSRETDVGWSSRRSTNDADLYSHPQREEWPPPPRYESNYSSTSYQDQYQPPASNSYPQPQPWEDDLRHHDDRVQDQNSHRQSSRGADARWQREERAVYRQEQDNGWEPRRPEQDQRQNWDENSVDRQWEPAHHSWDSSQHGFDSSQRSHGYSQQNGHRSSSNRKNSRKSDSHSKVNGSNKDWREVDELNKYVPFFFEKKIFNVHLSCFFFLLSWSRRERQRDFYDHRYDRQASTRRKHSRSFSRSRSPAESHYSHRSRRRTPSPQPPRVSTRPSPSYTHFESPPPPKRRRRDSSPPLVRSVSPPDPRRDHERGRTGWTPPLPPVENRSPVSPISSYRRNDKVGFHRSVSPTGDSVRSHRVRSPTPVNHARAPSPQLPDPAPSTPIPSVDIPPPELKPAQATQDPPPQPQQKGKNKKVFQFPPLPTSQLFSILALEK